MDINKLIETANQFKSAEEKVAFFIGYHVGYEKQLLVIPPAPAPVTPPQKLVIPKKTAVAVGLPKSHQLPRPDIEPKADPITGRRSLKDRIYPERNCEICGVLIKYPKANIQKYCNDPECHKKALELRRERYADEQAKRVAANKKKVDDLDANEQQPDEAYVQSQMAQAFRNALVTKPKEERTAQQEPPWRVIVKKAKAHK